MTIKNNCSNINPRVSSNKELPASRALSSGARDITRLLDPVSKTLDVQSRNFQKPLNTPLMLFSVCLLSITLCACSGDNGDLMKFMNDVKHRPSKQIEPIPKLTPLPVFRFPENDTRRSPFKPVAAIKRADPYAPDQKRPRQPLEAYPLDALKYVGLLKEGNDVWALIKDPDKKVTPVKVGNYMGQNFGQVISIKNNEIKLEETLKDSGKWQKHITTLNLYTGK